MKIVINTVNFYNISGNVINVSNLREPISPAEHREHQSYAPHQLVSNPEKVSDEHPLIKQLEERLAKSEEENAALRDELRQLGHANLDK